MRRLLLLAAIVAALATALATGDAEAYPGTSCLHTYECSSGEVCIADDANANHGHCVRIRVLSRSGG